MAAPAAPSYPGNKPSGNPFPRRGQIKAKILRDLISFVASIAGRMIPAAAAEHAGVSRSAAADDISAAPPPEQLPIAVV